MSGAPAVRHGAVDFDPDGPEVQALRRRVLDPWSLRAYMLRALPMGVLAGMKATQLTDQVCTVTVPSWWLTHNPFRSTYFAVLSMAAEMSTGAPGLVLVLAAPRPVSMYIVAIEGTFTRRAVDITSFRCEDPPKMAEALRRTLATGEPCTATCETVGTDPQGREIARFRFTWSFKAKE